MKKNKIIFAILPVLLGLAAVNIANAQNNKYPQITDQSCDAVNACPAGLECFNFPGIGLRCAQTNPCSYFECPKEAQCLIGESYPESVMCSCVGAGCPASSEGEKTVSYNLVTQTVIQTTDENAQPVSHDISLWQMTPENKGILETTFASVEYTNELIVKESKLFMKTSVGEKPINAMPEDAISKASDIESVQKTELKEEAGKPIYSIKGVKRAKIFFLFPVSLEIETKVGAETGQVISVKKPWWSFLAW